MPDGEKLLKRGLHRSVWLSSSGETVIKRFRSRGAWRRATDGRRARREARMLARLAELGLPVPQLIALDRSRDGWELRSAALPGARSLEDALGGSAAEGLRPDADPAELGDALARFHASGFLHGDLHPGNLLATPRGAWFMIDLSSGRLRRPPNRAAALDELTSLLGAVRERVPTTWRRELWRAWSSGMSGGTDMPSESEWDAVEDAARRARHRSVLAHTDRWLRPSSRLRSQQVGDDAWLVNADAEDLGELLQRLDRGTLSLPTGVAKAHERATLISGPDAKRHWINTARATEHGLPALRLCAWSTSRSLAVFEPTRADAPRPLRADDRGAAALAEALADRGLWLTTPPLIEFTSNDRLVISPTQMLPNSFTPGPTTNALEHWLPEQSTEADRTAE